MHYWLGRGCGLLLRSDETEETRLPCSRPWPLHLPFFAFSTSCWYLVPSTHSVPPYLTLTRPTYSYFPSLPFPSLPDSFSFILTIVYNISSHYPHHPDHQYSVVIPAILSSPCHSRLRISLIQLSGLPSSSSSSSPPFSSRFLRKCAGGGGEDYSVPYDNEGLKKDTPKHMLMILP